MTGWGLPIYPPPLAQTLAMPTPSLIGIPSRHQGSGETLVTVSCEARPRLVGFMVVVMLITTGTL